MPALSQYVLSTLLLLLHPNLALADETALCYEARPADYPQCGDYEIAGYSCKGAWCAASFCAGDCGECAEVREGYVVDRATGRCVAVERMGQGVLRFVQGLPAKVSALLDTYDVYDVATAKEVSSGLAASPLSSLLLLTAVLLCVYCMFALCTLVLSALQSVLSFGSGVFVGLLIFVLVEDHLPTLATAVRHFSHVVFATKSK